MSHRNVLLSLSLSLSLSSALPIDDAPVTTDVELVSSRVESSGAVTAVFSNGITVSASPGAHINFLAKTAPNGKSGSTEVSITPPQITPDKMAEAAAAYAAAGRSPLGDALAAGFKQSDIESLDLAGTAPVAPAAAAGEVYDSGCATVDGSVF